MLSWWIPIKLSNDYKYGLKTNILLWLKEKIIFDWALELHLYITKSFVLTSVSSSDNSINQLGYGVSDRLLHPLVSRQQKNLIHTT